MPTTSELPEEFQTQRIPVERNDLPTKNKRLCYLLTYLRCRLGRSVTDTYAQLVEKLELGDKPDRIWNCDESGVNDQFDQGRVVGLVAQVGQPCYRITPGEKGTTTTLLA